MVLRRWNAIVLALSLLTVLGMTPLLFGQNSNGTITGTVLDPTGAAMPGAQVTATGEGVGSIGKAVSGPDGGYVYQTFPPPPIAWKSLPRASRLRFKPGLF